MFKEFTPVNLPPEQANQPQKTNEQTKPKRNNKKIAKQKKLHQANKKQTRKEKLLQEENLADCNESFPLTPLSTYNITRMLFLHL